MKNITNKCSKLFKKIKENANICIYGSNEIAKNIYEELKIQRSDVNVKFFVDSTKEFSLDGLPVYLAENLDKYIKENNINVAIIASYAARFYMELVLNMFGINDIVMIDKSFVEPDESEKISYDVEKSARVFKTHKDRQLYRFIAKARKNKAKYNYKIKQYYDKNYPEKILCYPLQHYYEFINKDAIEVAIDGGACNAIHSLMNLQQFPNCKKVYAFEPCYEDFKENLLDKIIKKKPEIEIIDKALWDTKTKLQFRKESYSHACSAIIEVKPNINRMAEIVEVETTTIDDFVEENNIKKIDFIKFDLENAEMKALHGAEKTLLKCRPQLAISIYHSDEHYYEIPLYLKKLLPNYEFRLGHYRGEASETVLYGIPKELA